MARQGHPPPVLKHGPKESAAYASVEPVVYWAWVLGCFAFGKGQPCPKTRGESKVVRQSWECPRAHCLASCDGCPVGCPATAAGSSGRLDRALSASIYSRTRKVVNYTLLRRSRGKLRWKSGSVLTCKSFVRAWYRGERLIERPSSWFPLKFPSGSLEPSCSHEGHAKFCDVEHR